MKVVLVLCNWQNRVADPSSYLRRAVMHSFLMKNELPVSPHLLYSSTPRGIGHLVESPGMPFLSACTMLLDRVDKVVYYQNLGYTPDILDFLELARDKGKFNIKLVRSIA